VRDPDFEPEIVPRQPRRRPRKAGRTRRFTTLRVADFVAATVAAGAILVVVLNATALQGARHPAPLFVKPQAATTPPPAAAKRAAPVVPAAPLLDPSPAVVPVPQPRPAAAPSRSRTDLVLDVQRELAARGFYDGAVDGALSPRTTQAIRAFEQAQGVRVAGDANEVVLAQIRRAAPNAEIITGSIRPQETKPGRVLGVQRALANYGYGPLRITGQRDAETRAAIERFEKSRELPVTGEVSERLVRELAVFTGSPVE
jgi:peptidoglycan hydrolase-like protein with peptidoglycan-binding domain